MDSAKMIFLIFLNKFDGLLFLCFLNRKLETKYVEIAAVSVYSKIKVAATDKTAAYFVSIYRQCCVSRHADRIVLRFP